MSSRMNEPHMRASLRLDMTALVSCACNPIRYSIRLPAIWFKSRSFHDGVKSQKLYKLEMEEDRVDTGVSIKQLMNLYGRT